jgi:predicted Ser/Thr protein kinase
MSTKIGRFEIVTELAKSATSAVYKANDPNAGRTVALKTIRFDLPADLARILIEIILREADCSKVLNSQNIAALYGAGDMDGQFCAAMEYVEGNSLANMIASQEGFSIWDILDISRQVCNALDHADSHGVLHKGLEPGKIMMQWDGTVKVLGYGISTMVSAMPSKGANVPPLFYYMSPEQVKGDVMDIRSNIFSWGAMLYEMVTERKPFTGDDIQTVRQKILEETPEPPATINPRMNLGVSRVIMQALAKSPEERYAHGSELLSDLEKAKETSQQKVAKEASKAPSGLVIPEKLKSPGASSGKFMVPKASEEDNFVPAPAARVSAGTKAAAKPGPAVEGLVNAAGEEVSRTPKKAAAAAAGAGMTSSTVRPRPTATGVTRDAARMSAATAEPPAVEQPKFRTDPMMGDPPLGAGKQASFSDLDELPPLKESDFAPPPPPLPEPEEVHVTAPPAFVPTPRAAKPERPKVVTRENARKAVKEIKQVPPQLMMYAISAAVVVIVVVVLGLAYHFYQPSPDDETAAAPPSAETVQPEQAQAVEETPPTAAEEPQQPEVVVKPRYAPKKVKAAPVKPVIIPGEISISSTPEGAQVQIDGRSNPAWLTPYTLSGLAPGQHSISVSKPGFTPETRMIDVGAGSKSVVVVHLAQVGAAVAVGSQPAGAHVYLDGKDTGHVTPVQLLAEKGTHTFLVRKEGYLDETTTVELSAGQTFRYAPVLRVLGITEDIKTGGGFKRLFGGGGKEGMGKVTVKTQPKGAQITVNRRMVDKAAPVDFFLNPGNYIVDVTLSGYKPVHREISVESGSKVELNLNLEPE